MKAKTLTPEEETVWRDAFHSNLEETQSVKAATKFANQALLQKRLMDGFLGARNAVK